MNEIKSIKISPTSVILNVGDWYHGAKAEIYPTTIGPLNIIWSSDKQNVATVNPINGYVYAHNPGIAIITARLDDDETVTTCYTVCVENNKQTGIDTILSKESAFLNSNTAIVRQIDCDGYSSSAFGYSGTVYSYTISGGLATLTNGGISKTNTYGYYAASFQSAVYDMAVIYNSLSPLQLQAWRILRVYGILNSFSMGALDAILLLAGVDLQGQLESTIFAMNDWYRAEARAQDCFSKF